MPEVDITTDELIVKGLKNGEHKTLHLVYKKYWPMVLRFVLLNNGSSEDAEELYQNTIISLYEKEKDPGFQLKSSLKTFIYSVSRHKWLNELRKKKSLMDIEEYVDFKFEVREEDEIELPRDEALITAIASLGEPCKSLLTGFYYEKFSLEDLSRKMNYASANVAKQQKFRCIERLKKLFLEKRSKD